MTILIPFGDNCNTAQILMDGGMRQQSLPFDWVFSSPKLMKDSLDNNFSNWFDTSKIRHIVRPEDGHSYTTHPDYPISDDNGLKRGVFHHYNMTDPKTITVIKRRIDRFYEIMDSNDPVVFVTLSTKQELSDHGLLNYFNRSADTSFIFLDWVNSQENKIIVEHDQSDIKIQYFFENRYDKDNISPDICDIIKAAI